MNIINNPTAEDLASLRTKDTVHVWIIKNTLPSSKNPLIQTIINRYISGQFTICKNQHGKPFLQCNEQPPLHLSISHSGSYLVLALSFASPLGVDIEEIKDRPHWPKIAARYRFKSSCLETFYQEWTAREAFIKTVDIGLFTGLATINTEENEENFRIGTTALSHKIYFQQYDDYIVALCLNLSTNNYLKYFHI